MQAAAGPSIKVLNFYGDNGFRHPSQLSSVTMIENVCKKNNWVVISSNDPRVFQQKSMESISLVIFNNNCGNTGRILNDSQQSGFKKYIDRGGAFLAIHCAGAIWHEGTGFQQWYEQLIGATLVAHPPVQQALFKIEDQNHMATRHLPVNWILKEEMHTLSANPRAHSQVLVSVDENSYEGSPKMNGDHPMVWCRQFRKSKVFVTALGHTEEIYSDNDYVKMIEGGMKWCLEPSRKNRKEKHVSQDLSASSLLIDLDADKGLLVDSAGRLYQWENQAPYLRARYFLKQDSGRKTPCEGCPVLRKNVPAINFHNAVVFDENELVTSDEDAFDHLITGGGYTFLFVLSPSAQNGKLKNVNSFFGNLKNGGFYEGVWAGFTDSNQLWMGTRNGLSFGRWDVNNPHVQSKSTLLENRFYIIIGMMDKGQDTVQLSLFINDPLNAVTTLPIPVNLKANASKMVIGQERDAVEHPGLESFNGAIARFLLYDRPLSRRELTDLVSYLNKVYNIRK